MLIRIFDIDSGATVGDQPHDNFPLPKIRESLDVLSRRTSATIFWVEDPEIDPDKEFLFTPVIVTFKNDEKHIENAISHMSNLRRPG